MIAVVVLGAAGVAAVAIFATPGPTPPTSTASSPVDAPIVDARIVRPAPPVKIAAFAGSARCAECHEKEHAAWRTSWHARALAPGTPANVVGNFANAHYTGSSSEAWMRRAGAVATMRTRGADGELADFHVDWVIGGKRMQDTVTVFPDGRWQVLPVYFHVGDRSWVDYTEAKQGALSPEHPFYWTNARRMANHECLDCHTTGMRVGYDERAAHWNTTFTDGSVACESCHGAGAAHAESTEPADIVHPKKARAIAMTACARCHGPRRPLFPLLDPEHPFQLGESYDELYEPIVVTMTGGVSTDYFADGKPKTSSFEYQAMLQSACYRKGKLDCLTCHTAPHERKPGLPAELRVAPDETCSACHAPVFAAGKQHSHHTRVGCVGCHMAPIVSGVLDHFADHAIDVPVPENTTRHGVPNACSTCHPTRPADELARALAAWWPGAAARQQRRRILADAFDPATAKDSAEPLLRVIADRDEAPTLRGAALVTLARRFGAQSARVFEHVLATESDLVVRAKALEAIGEAHAAAAADTAARHLGDPSLRIRLAAAQALYDLRDPRAEAALHALADDPASSHLLVPHSELGLVLGARGDWRGAHRELEQAVRLAPYFLDGLLQLAVTDIELGDLDAADRRVAQALQLEPRHRGAASLLERLAKLRGH